MQDIDMQQEKLNSLNVSIKESVENIQSTVGTEAEATVEICSTSDAKKFLAKQLVLLGEKLQEASIRDCAKIAHAMAEIGDILVRY